MRCCKMRWEYKDNREHKTKVRDNKRQSRDYQKFSESPNKKCKNNAKDIPLSLAGKGLIFGNNRLIIAATLDWSLYLKILKHMKKTDLKLPATGRAFSVWLS